MGPLEARLSIDSNLQFREKSLNGNIIWVHKVIYILWAKQETAIQLVILERNQQCP